MKIDMRHLADALMRYRYSILIAFVLLFMARGQIIFQPLHSIDSYGIAAREPGEAATAFWLLLKQGRLGAFLILWLFDAINYLGIGVAVSVMFISTILFVCAAFCFSIAILRGPTVIESLIFILVFTLHPFLTEYYTFPDGTFFVSLPCFLSAVGLLLALRFNRSPTDLIVATAILIFAFSIYQTSIAYLLVGWLFSLVARICNDGAPPNFKPMLAHPEVKAAVPIFSSIAIYLGAIAVIARLSGVSGLIGINLSSATPLEDKLSAWVVALNAALWPIESLITHTTSVALIILLILSALALIWTQIRRGSGSAALICFVLIAAALVVSVGSFAGGKGVWIVPRILTPFAAFCAGLIMLSWRFSASRLHLVQGALLALLFLSFIGASNHILYDQRRLNLWDAQEANRILARLELRLDYSKIRALALDGHPWGRTLILPTATGDMNVSGLGSPENDHLIEQLTGYRFAVSTPAEKQTARKYCEGKERWPAAESVIVLGDLAIVCLKNSP